MTPPADSLSDKVAFITGAGSGLGEAMARLLAACGARVAVVDRAAEQAARVAAEITAAGGTARALTADVSVAAQVDAVMQEVAQIWGRLDILCANAGTNGIWAPVDDLTAQEWDETLDVNLKGTFLVMRAGVPLMKQSGRGSIIITSSIVGTCSFSLGGASAYAASKAGQVALGLSAALELAKHRIRVNVICPGAIKTNIRANRRNTTGLIPPVQLPQGSVPLTPGSAGEPEQVARLVWFLASDLSDHITGAEIVIDGGQTLLVG